MKEEHLSRDDYIAHAAELVEGQESIRAAIANHTMSLTEIAQSLSDSQVGG